MYTSLNYVIIGSLNDLPPILSLIQNRNVFCLKHLPIVPCWVSLGAAFTISLIEFYFIMIFNMIVVTLIGIFVAIIYILNYTFRLFVTKYFWYANAQLEPSTLAVPEQLSNGGGKNVGHSPAESGTDFWALCTTSATLWPL